MPGDIDEVPPRSVAEGRNGKDHPKAPGLGEVSRGRNTFRADGLELRRSKACLQLASDFIVVARDQNLSFLGRCDVPDFRWACHGGDSWRLGMPPPLRSLIVAIDVSVNHRVFVVFSGWIAHASRHIMRSGAVRFRTACTCAIVKVCLRQLDLFRGTFAPFLRASESPIAIACCRLFTFPPFPALPERNVPRFLRSIALRTDLAAAFPYLAISSSRINSRNSNPARSPGDSSLFRIISPAGQCRHSPNIRWQLLYFRKVRIFHRNRLRLIQPLYIKHCIGA